MWGKSGGKKNCEKKVKKCEICLTGCFFMSNMKV